MYNDFPSNYSIHLIVIQIRTMDDGGGGYKWQLDEEVTVVSVCSDDEEGGARPQSSHLAP